METIETYLKDEKNASDSVIESVMAKLNSHLDIRAEFVQWLDTRSYPVDSPVKVEGYSAKDIADLAPFLDGIGAYTFLIALRDDPTQAKEIIRAGFPRK